MRPSLLTNFKRESDESPQLQELEDEQGMSKGQLMQLMEQVDDEIGKTEKLLQKVSLQKPQLDAQQKPPLVQIEKQKKKKFNQVESAQLIADIYAQNRSLLVQEPQVELIDQSEQEQKLTEVQNKFQSKFKSLLQKNMHARDVALKEKEQRLHQEYDALYSAWQQKIVAYEDRQRDSKKLQVLVSEYDQHASPYGFPNPDEDFRYLKTLAVVPDMILDVSLRNMKYINSNTLLNQDDTSQSTRTMVQNNPWTEEERSQFMQLYLEYPKEFGHIAQYLPNKTASDCVLFYYLNKKSLKLKPLTKQALNIRNRKRMKQQQQMEEAMVTFVEPQARRRNSEKTPVIAHEEVSPQQEVLQESEWTDEELAIAKSAFQTYGKDFYKVAAEVGTRTILECRRLYKLNKHQNGVDLTQHPSLESVAEHTEPEIVNTEVMPKNQQEKKKRSAKKRAVSYWSSKDKQEFQRLLLIHTHDQNVVDYPAIAEQMPSKSEVQVRNYHVNSQDTGVTPPATLLPQAQTAVLMPPLDYSYLYSTQSPYMYLPALARPPLFHQPVVPGLPGLGDAAPLITQVALAGSNDSLASAPAAFSSEPLNQEAEENEQSLRHTASTEALHNGGNNK